MIREEVINHWTGLKEKFNSLKFTEPDKKVIDCLRKSPLTNVICFNASEISKWETEAQTLSEQLDSFEPENDLIVDYWSSALSLISAVKGWINDRKIISSSREYVNELEDWKTNSRFLLFEAKTAIQKGMLNLIPVNEADNPQRAKEDYEFMKATKNQISRVID